MLTIQRLLSLVIWIESKMQMFEFVEGRVFIDIGEGCGNSCTYCYVKGKSNIQVVFSSERIIEGVNKIISDSRFIPGVTIISFCPHTEPFKTSTSVDRMLETIELLAPMGNCIQIATKEVVPDRFLEAVKKIVLPNQLMIFISCSCFMKSSQIEPYAADYKLRLANIEKCRLYGIHSVLYLKPFLLSNEDMDVLKAELKRYRPDVVCLGIIYQKNDKGEYRHPTNGEMTSQGMDDKMYLCANMIRLYSPVFYTSTCVNAWFNNIVNNVNIPKQLCVKCNTECFKQKWNE